MSVLDDTTTRRHDDTTTRHDDTETPSWLID
jgi:hypothetical protein